MAGKIIDLFLNGPNQDGAGCSRELDRLSRNQDRTSDELQRFYREQKTVNDAAIQELKDLGNRTGALETQSDKTRKFMKKQKRINQKTADTLRSIEDRLDDEPNGTPTKKRGMKKQTSAMRMRASEKSYSDVESSDED